MTTVLLAMIVFVLAVAGLALGVLLGRKPVTGSCGGCVICLVRRGQHD